MKHISPTISFSKDYMIFLAMKEAEKIPYFKGKELSGCLEWDEENQCPSGGIIVAEYKEPEEI